MKGNTHRSNKDSMLRAECTMLAVAINVVLAYLSNRLGLPIYLDTIGTMCIAAMAGLFPGIMAAIATNVLCIMFDDTAIYFGIVNVIVAMYTAWSVREKNFRKVKTVVVFILTAGVLAGSLSAILQYGLFRGTQNAAINTLMETVVGPGKTPGFTALFVVNVFLNIFNLGLSIVVTLIILYLVPDETQKRIRYSGWRQKPLTKEELKEMDFLSRSVDFSVKKRTTIMLFGVAFTLSLIMAWIGIRLYFKSYKESRIDSATYAAKFAAELIDGDQMAEYLAKGEKAPGYAETEHMLTHIRETAAGVTNLYAVQFRENGVHIAFDLDTEDMDGVEAGTILPLKEAFKPYINDFYAGREVEPIESDSLEGWLVTACAPIFDSKGRCVGYAAADVVMSYVTEYLGDFFMRAFMIMSGFFILVLGYGLWTAGIYMVYPLDKMMEGVEEFIEAGADQQKLDDAVRHLRTIDVHTGDEIEKLYELICNMASNQTEQIRSIQRFNENTAKLQDGLIITMADLVENRDSDTGDHIQKTAAYVKIIVEGLKKKGYYAEKLTPKFMSDVVRSAPLHDIGKINISDKVLNKPGKLTDEEYEVIKTHTTAGKDIIEKAINTVKGESYLKEARNMAAYHHERWDGNGYPEGLHGEVIPLSARIMAVADVFDALTSPRVYKEAYPLDVALKMLEDGSGTQFDPKCVEVFIEALPEVKVIWRRYNQGNQRGSS